MKNRAAAELVGLRWAKATAADKKAVGRKLAAARKAKAAKLEGK